MITINVNDELVKVETWEDIVERPLYRGNLDPTKHELGSIIGRYLLGDRVRCGLSNCHTPHGRGFLVKTKDGLETNIGKDCGSTYFGVDFDDQSRQFERDLAERDGRELLWTTRFGLEDLEGRIEGLREGEHGAKWVHKNVSALRNPAKTPTAIRRMFDQLVRDKTGRLTAPRLATEKEIDQMEGMRAKKGPGPYYIDELVGNIRGIEAMYEEYDLRTLLTVELEEKIKEFREVDINTLQLRELTRWSKWIQSIEQIFETARDSVSLGRILLTRTNLEPMLKKIEADDLIGQNWFKEILQSLPPI